MTYFVVKGSEDGTQVHVCKDDRELKGYIEDACIKQFRAAFGPSIREGDPNYWPEDMALIIKGDVIVPKPKEVVKDWEF